MSFHEQSKSGLRISLAPLVSDLQAFKVLALERLEKALERLEKALERLDLPSKLTKCCHNQANKGLGKARKSLRKVRSSFRAY